MGIHELWSSIPSPKKPAADDWTPLSAGDRAAHSYIMRGDNIKGIKTDLYTYQLVRFIVNVPVGDDTDFQEICKPNAPDGDSASPTH